LHDASRFLEACRGAQRAGVPVLALKSGASEKGRRSVRAHTGALAGSVEAFEAVTGSVGVHTVDSLDELIEATDFFSFVPRATASGIAAITFSGAATALLEDAAQRHDIDFAALKPKTMAELHTVLGSDHPVTNP